MHRATATPHVHAFRRSTPARRGYSQGFLAPILALAILARATDASAQERATPPPLSELAGLRWTNAFFPGASYRAEVPTGETLLGFPIGQRAATPAEIGLCLQAWATAAPGRTRLVTYARSHEDRPLQYMIITAPQNVSQLDEIRQAMARLADPRTLADADAKRLIDQTLKPVAWLGYTIHGGETEGSDAALAVLYHLIAAQDPPVAKLLEDVIVIIDPLQNPDGRERFLKMIAESRGTTPSVDDQSLQHTGYAPWGRGNHYYFDLNRDSLFGVHPETRGRMKEVARWNPVLVVDAHGMGAQDTHLFSPPREPVNVHVPPSRQHWSTVFARDQAAAFDRHGLVYYHGEWNEGWYPGYTDTWPAFRGSVGILYEQARIAEDGVRRPEGRILSYRESVFHHVVGSMANLTTVQANAKPLLESFLAIRRTACAADGPYATRTFAIPPTANRARLDKFLDLARLHGFELLQTASEFTPAHATDHLGRDWKDRKLPAGTILIPNRQPLGHLVAATLDFDPRMPAKALEDERQEVLRTGGSRIYDTTAWNLTMMFGLEAVILPDGAPEAARPLVPAPATDDGLKGEATAAVAYAIDGANDASVTAAARLMERGVQVRAAHKDFELDGHKCARGSIVITRLDNRGFAGDLARVIDATAREVGVPVQVLRGGLGEGDLPDLGGEYFQRLEPPRIALLSRGGSSIYDVGEIWFLLDHELSIRHARVSVEGSADLSRYNVVIIPEHFGGPLPGSWTNRLKDWVKAGGTLIAMGGSAAQLADEKSDFSKVRDLPDVLNKPGDYELAVLREWLARQSNNLPPVEALWANKVAPGLKYPWQAIDGPHPEEKELKKRDAWLKLFMPQGALAATRLDAKHWLTFGCEEPMPVLAFRGPVLMAAEGVEAPIRLGYLTPGASQTAVDATGGAQASGSESKTADRKDAESSAAKEKKEPPRVGWSALPTGTEMHLRMSGLLWPEAAYRLANSAYVTRETLGRGQIILFATGPTFRAATLGPTRVMLNAMIYGPGFGATQPVRP